MGDYIGGMLGQLGAGNLGQNYLLQQQQYQQQAALLYGSTATSGIMNISIGKALGLYPEPTRSLTDKRSPNEVWLDKRVSEICVTL